MIQTLPPAAQNARSMPTFALRGNLVKAPWLSGPSDPTTAHRNILGHKDLNKHQQPCDPRRSIRRLGSQLRRKTTLRE